MYLYIKEISSYNCIGFSIVSAGLFSAGYVIGFENTSLMLMLW
jgi:hypothetical protein